MHISDGILSLKWCAFWYAVCIPFWYLGIREIRKKSEKNPKYKPMLALMGAAVFIISVWHIPVPVTGSCSHPVGTPMAAIIVGSFATVVITSIALFFQRFLDMEVSQLLELTLFPWELWALLLDTLLTFCLEKAKVPLWLSAGSAEFVGDMVTYLTSSFELAVGLHANNVLHYWWLYFMGYGPTQIPLAIGEFIFTAAVVQYIAERSNVTWGIAYA